MNSRSSDAVARPVLTEDVSPFGKSRFGECHGTTFVAGVDKLEKQIAAAGDDRQISNLINDQESWLGNFEQPE